MKITFLGSGNLVQSILDGYFKKKSKHSFNLFFYTPSQSRAILAAKKYDGEVVTTLDSIPSSEIYVFGFKPQSYSNALKDYSDLLAKDAQIWSLLAGYPVTRIQEDFTQQKVLRIMPNTCSRVGEGISLYTHLKDDLNLAVFKEIFGAVSSLFYMHSDELLDKVTGVSGSGSALLYEFIKAMQETIKGFGVSHEVASQIGTSLIHGSGLLLNQEGNIENLQDQITSYKGVTEAALESLRSNDLKKIVEKSILEAFRRSQELAKS